MPKVDIDALDWTNRTSYPEPFRDGAKGRFRKALGNAGQLTQYGVNLTRLEPGATSAQRHWHEREDEFVYILAGELVLVEENEEAILCAGDAAAFKAGVENAHHLVNRSSEAALFLEIGTRVLEERGHYPDIDLAYARDANGYRFTHKDGTPYPSDEVQK